MYYNSFGEIMKIFDDFSGAVVKKNYPTPSFPPVKVIQRKDNLEFKFFLAGYKKDEIKLKFDKDCLVLTADHEESVSEDEKVIVNNLKTPNFSYKYFIPEDKFDFNTAEAEFTDGVLIIKVASKEEVKQEVREIEIK